MTNEKIISIIETYISSLENSEKELYKNSLLSFDNKEGRTYYVPVQGLALLVSDLKRELSEAEIKKSKGNTFLKRSKLAEKLINQNEREHFRKGWIETDVFDNKYQCFMTSYYGFMLSENLEIPMYDEQDEKPFNMSNMFKNVSENLAGYDIGKIKAEYKSHKPKTKDNWRCLVQFGDVYFNAEHFIQCVDILGEEPAFYCGKPREVAIFESKNGKALLCPITLMNKTNCYIFDGEKV